MGESMHESLLTEASTLLAARMGLLFPPQRWRDLERGLHGALQELGYTDFEAGVRWLLSTSLSPAHVNTLAGHLTVGETYFLRDGHSVRVLEQHVLPELIAARRQSGRHLRIWSAGCCTGEEPYSIAMLLHKLLPDRRDWHISIVGTDLNPRFLAKAADGVYSEWSFRGTPAWVKERYFSPVAPGRWAILPEIRAMVTFAIHNLVDEVEPATDFDTQAMDLILCRNVLIYFGAEQARQVVNRFHRALRPDGWLALGPSETIHVAEAEFVTMHFDGAILHQKTPAGAARERAFVRLCDSLPAIECGALPVDEPDEVPVGFDRDFDVMSPPECLWQPADEVPLQVVAAPVAAEPPSDLESLRQLATIEANRGNLDAALACCEQAAIAGKLDPGLHYLGATILQEKGDLPRAATALQRALYLDPDFVLAHFALGNVESKRGHVHASRKCFENARALLAAYGPEDVLPQSVEVTARRLAAILDDLAHKEVSS